MVPELVRSFDVLVSRKLRDGRVLLVDGSDEISDEGDRISFVRQLRTFLATYPNVALVVTSREAGFRIIGGALSSQCEHFRLADFDDDDIKKLTLELAQRSCGRHGPSQRATRPNSPTPSARTRAHPEEIPEIVEHLHSSITLLFGETVGSSTANPENRIVRQGYRGPIDDVEHQKGTNLLIRTRLLPQLEYLAFEMMRAGIQTISSRLLTQRY